MSTRQEKIEREVTVKTTARKISTKWWGPRRKIIFLAMLILGILCSGLRIQAQEYPTRPITMLISHAPGAGTDVCSRMVTKGATKTLGQEIIPVNKPGGGGSVSVGILANSKGDGYTILALTSSAITNIPHLESVPYDPLKDIVPIIQFGSLITGIVVRSDSPHKSFRDFVDFARKNPGKVSFGTPGIGIAPHVALAHVMLEEKVDITVIPFGGATPTLTALLGGHISACGVSTSGFLPHLKAGKVRVLATTGDKRIEVIPDVPTLHELGYPYGILIEIYLIVAPKGTPSAVVKTLEGAFRKAMETPEFRALAENFYMFVENPLSGQKLKEYIEEQYSKNGEIIRKAKLVK